jgi:hypothetical protein
MFDGPTRLSSRRTSFWSHKGFLNQERRHPAGMVFGIFGTRRLAAVAF